MKLLIGAFFFSGVTSCKTFCHINILSHPWTYFCVDATDQRRRMHSESPRLRLLAIGPPDRGLGIATIKIPS